MASQAVLARLNGIDKTLRSLEATLKQVLEKLDAKPKQAGSRARKETR
ncbi:MAG TPA: hypothetical protein VFT36_09090 [Methylomirabilota bacterium]|nr:hypothetical protein [Methylomirabilota bacterium]